MGRFFILLIVCFAAYHSGQWFAELTSNADKYGQTRIQQLNDI